MCQDNIQTHFGKRDTARDQILAESCGEISVLIWEVLVLPFFAPFTQYIIIIHIHEMTHPRQSIVSLKISSTIWVKKLI